MSGQKFRGVLFTSIMIPLLLFGLNLLPVDYAHAAGKTAVVTGSGVNVRSGPGTNYSKVGAVYKGEKYVILKQKNGWHNLRLSSGSSGWVKGIYLRITESKSSSTSSQSGAAAKSNKIAVIRKDNINIRNGPGEGYGKVTKVNKGQQFAIIKESRGWYNISLPKGKSGWVAAWLVTVKNKQTPVKNIDSGSTGADKTVGTHLIVKEDIVNIRSGAGTNFKITTKVKAGDRLTVVKKSGEWCLVNLPDQKQGWIAHRYTEPLPVDPPSRDDTNQAPNRSPVPENPQPVSKLQSVELTSGDNGQELLTIKSENAIKYSLKPMIDPARLVIDIDSCEINGLKDFTSGGTFVNQVRVAQYSLTPMTVRVVLDLNRPVWYASLPVDDNKTLTVTLSECSTKDRIIVIDAGHGGYDPGAVGVTGLEEKGFNLETALLLRDKLTNLGATVILTREADTFISLTERAEVANKVYADAFVSIHANFSDNNLSARGTSTYYYAPSSNPDLYYQLEQRKRLAGAVQNRLVNILGTRDAGVLQANFAVLRGTAMPSILVETAFLSNPDDEALLKDYQFRDRTAQGIAEGLVDYFSGWG